MICKRTAVALALIGLSPGSNLAQRSYAGIFARPAFANPQARQFRLGHLTVTGNTHTKLYVILRMIPLAEGDIFNQSLWEFGLEQINRSGLFEPIEQSDVVLKPDDVTGLVDVELRLKERDRQRIDMSGGGGTTGGASISLDYSNSNLTGRGDRLAGRARIGTRERSGGATLSVMSFGRLPISFDLSGFFERLEYVNANTPSQGGEPLFVQRTAGGSLGAFLPLIRSRYTIAASTRVGILYSFTSTNLADALLVSPASPRTLEQNALRIGTLTPLLIHDTLDRQLDPQRGERLVIGAETGARALGGSLNSFKLNIDYRRFFNLGRNNIDQDRESPTIGFRIRALHIRAFGEPFHEQALSTVSGVPVFRRVFLGGETEIRGYDVNSISPLARVDRFVLSPGNPPVFLSGEVRPVGGDTEVLFNAEYRVPIIWRLSGAAFVDIGASIDARGIHKESFETMTTVQSTGAPVTVLTILKPLKEGQDFIPGYRASLGGELRFPTPVLNIPIRLIFSWNPNAQTLAPNGALLVPEKRFSFRLGFSRTL